MKIKLQLKKTDFLSFEAFKKSVEFQLGSDLFVGEKCVCLYFDYSAELLKALENPPGCDTFFELVC